MSNKLPENQTMPLKTVFYVALLCIAFGANPIAIKISLTGVGVFTAVGIRFTIASIVIFIWAGLTGRSFRIKREKWGQLAIVSVVFLLQLSIVYSGLSKTHASRATLLMNLQPFFILFLAHFFIPGDRINIRKTLGISLGFSGVVFVFLEGRNLSADLVHGDLLVLATALLWSCNTIYIKRIIHGFRPFQLVFYPMLFSVPFFYAEAFLMDQKMIISINFQVIASILYQSIVTASFGFIVWNSLLRKYGAVSLHGFVFIMPVSGVLFGGAMLGEPVSPSIISAMVFITAGIFVLHFKPSGKVSLQIQKKEKESEIAGSLYKTETY